MADIKLRRVKQVLAPREIYKQFPSALHMPRIMASDDAYDIVIIGGGTAGLVLAARLSEDVSLQVAVIESGESQKDDPRVLTPGAWMTLTNSSIDWAFKTVPQASRHSAG